MEEFMGFGSGLVDKGIDFLVHFGNDFNEAAAHHPRSLEDDQAHFFKAIMKEQIGEFIAIAARHEGEWQSWRQDGMSPLRYAQDSMSFQSFVQLCAMDINKNEDYGNGWTPLLFAVNYGDRTFIDYTLSHNPDLNGLATVDGKGHTSTALHLAIERRDVETIQQLIEHGADTKVKARTKFGLLNPQEYAEARHEKKLGEMLGLAPQIKALHDERFAPFKPAAASKPLLAAA